MNIKEKEGQEISSKLFQFQEVLGKGAFGEVKSAIYLPENIEVAVKILEKQRICSSDSELRLESLLAGLDHPNILKYLKVHEFTDRAYIVMEKMEGGSLMELIHEYQKQGKTIMEQDASIIIRGILNGLAYLHKLNIVHRDIKPENILFAKKGDLNSVKIADLGLGAKCSFGSEKILEGLHGQCGTLKYSAPELLGKRQYHKPVDIFSAGIIMYMLISGGEHPIYIPGMSKEEYINRLNNYTPIFSPAFSKLSINFYEKLTIRTPINRYTAVKALSHPWITRTLTTIPLNVIEKLNNLDRGETFKSVALLLYYIGSLVKKNKGISTNYQYKAESISKQVESWNAKRKRIFSNNGDYVLTEKSPEIFTFSKQVSPARVKSPRQANRIAPLKITVTEEPDMSTGSGGEELPTNYSNMSKDTDDESSSPPKPKSTLTGSYRSSSRQEANSIPQAVYSLFQNRIIPGTNGNNGSNGSNGNVQKVQNVQNVENVNVSDIFPPTKGGAEEGNGSCGINKTKLAKYLREVHETVNYNTEYIPRGGRRAGTPTLLGCSPPVKKQPIKRKKRAPNQHRILKCSSWMENKERERGSIGGIGGTDKNILGNNMNNHNNNNNNNNNKNIYGNTMNSKGLMGRRSNSVLHRVHHIDMTKRMTQGRPSIPQQLPAAAEQVHPFLNTSLPECPFDIVQERTPSPTYIKTTNMASKMNIRSKSQGRGAVIGKGMKSLSAIHHSSMQQLIPVDNEQNKVSASIIQVEEQKPPSENTILKFPHSLTPLLHKWGMKSIKSIKSINTMKSMKSRSRDQKFGQFESAGNIVNDGKIEGDTGNKISNIGNISNISNTQNGNSKFVRIMKSLMSNKSPHLSTQITNKLYIERKKASISLLEQLPHITNEEYLERMNNSRSNLQIAGNKIRKSRSICLKKGKVDQISLI